MNWRKPNYGSRGLQSETRHGPAAVVDGAAVATEHRSVTVKKRQMEQVERGYRQMLNGMAGMLRVFQIVSAVRRSDLPDEQHRMLRTTKLTEVRRHIRYWQREVAEVRSGITWKPTPYTRRREREIERLTAEVHLENWRQPARR